MPKSYVKTFGSGKESALFCWCCMFLRSAVGFPDENHWSSQWHELGKHPALIPLDQPRDQRSARRTPFY